MWKQTGFLILTLVVGLTQAHGAKVPPQPDVRNPQEETSKETSSETDQSVLSTTDILPAPPPPYHPDENIEPVYLYDRAVTPRLGILMDFQKMKPDYAPEMTYGFTYLFPSRTPFHWEAGVEGIADSSLMASFGNRFVFNHQQNLRPFAKASLKTRLIPKEQMATLVNFENFQGAVSLGIEDKIGKRYSAHFEMELALGSRFRTFIIYAGVVMPF